MVTKRSDQRREGRYVHGGTPTVKGDRIGWWERKIYTRSPLDVEYVVTKRYAKRPDLLAYDLYGRANLMWFILQYNHVSDVATEFVEGTVLMLPTANRLFSEILTSKS